MMDVEEDGETVAGPANDETDVVGDSAETLQGWLAWSDDDPDDDDGLADPARQSWGAAFGVAAVLLACAGVAALMIGSAGYAHRDETMLPAAPSSSWQPPAPPTGAPPPVTETVTATPAAPTWTPQPSPPQPTKTVTAPTPDTKDQAFLRALQDVGITPPSPAWAVSDAQAVCNRFRRGDSRDDIIAVVKRASPKMNDSGAVNFVNLSTRTYCPEYAAG
jgi:Protein of unknown function (DUF732)